MNKCTSTQHLLNFQFVFCTSLFSLVPCPCLSLLHCTSGLGLVGSCQRGCVACISPPFGAWEWVWVGAWARGWAGGCPWVSTSMGAASRAALGRGWGAYLASDWGLRFVGLGAGSSGGSTSGLGLGFFFGLLGISSTLLLLPMGRYCSMRGIQQQPLNTNHLLFPLVFHPNPPANNNGGRNPWVDTIGVGHKNLCTKQGIRCGIPLQSGGFLTPLLQLLLLLLPLHLRSLSTGNCVVTQRQAARLAALAVATGALYGFGGFAGGSKRFGFLCRGGGGGTLLGRGFGSLGGSTHNWTTGPPHQHLSANLAQGDHILVPRDSHANDPQEGGCSRLCPMVQ